MHQALSTVDRSATNPALSERGGRDGLATAPPGGLAVGGRRPELALQPTKSVDCHPRVPHHCFVVVVEEQLDRFSGVVGDGNLG
jgi:hypothetical protein